MKKRNLDLLVISDVHLGTFGCRANKLLKYLKSVNPKKIVLNGDIIDGWQFTKYYFPNSHLKVIKYLIKMATTGTKVFYITGNLEEWGKNENFMMKAVLSQTSNQIKFFFILIELMLI